MGRAPRGRGGIGPGGLVGCGRAAAVRLVAFQRVHGGRAHQIAPNTLKKASNALEITSKRSRDSSKIPSAGIPTGPIRTLVEVLGGGGVALAFPRGEGDSAMVIK